MSNFNDIISILDTLNQENALSFYLPSEKREVKFKSISTGQQKNLLKASVDNPVFQTRFLIAIYNIITENCQEKDVLARLTTLDLISILLQYRVNLYGNKFVVKAEDKSYNVNLQSCIDAIKSTTVPPHQLIQEGVFSIQVGVPSLTDTYQLEKQLREKSLSEKDLINVNNISINDTIGDAFIGEVSKYIKDITIEKGDIPHNINYGSLSFAKRFTVLEKIPTSVVRTLFTHITKLTEIQRKITQIEGVEVTTGKVELVNVPTDASLFVME